MNLKLICATQTGLVSSGSERNEPEAPDSDNQAEMDPVQMPMAYAIFIFVPLDHPKYGRIEKVGIRQNSARYRKVSISRLQN